MTPYHYNVTSLTGFVENVFLIMQIVRNKNCHMKNPNVLCVEMNFIYEYIGEEK